MNTSFRIFPFWTHPLLPPSLLFQAPNLDCSWGMIYAIHQIIGTTLNPMSHMDLKVAGWIGEPL